MVRILRLFLLYIIYILSIYLNIFISLCYVYYFLCLANNLNASHKPKPQKYFNYYNSPPERSLVHVKVFQSSNDKGFLAKENSTVKLDTALPTKVLIHGWTNTGKVAWYKLMKDSFFKTGPHNVIFVDWGLLAFKPYLEAIACIKPIAEIITDFLVDFKIKPDKIHIIGHSLGAHIASFVGKIYFDKRGVKLGRITGNDPACPVFEDWWYPGEERINKNVAKFVDIIHTNAGIYGIKNPAGHADFYPNGGKVQPGCPVKIDHCKIYLIKIENEKFLGSQYNYFILISISF